MPLMRAKKQIDHEEELHVFVTLQTFSVCPIYYLNKEFKARLESFYRKYQLISD